MAEVERLRTRVGSLDLATPLLTGSGTFGHDPEAALQFLGPEDLGAHVLKTVTPQPRHGNPAPRLVETPAGLLNSIGLENRGLAWFLEHLAPRHRSAPWPVVGNAGGETIEEFVEVVRGMDAEPALAAIEVNLSCPNVQGAALPWSTVPQALTDVVSACREVTAKPLWVKLTPNVTRIGPLAEAAAEAHADALTVCNTLVGLVIDWRARKPALGQGMGGLSGPAVRPVAMRLVWECRQATDLPIVASGGAADAEDVLQFLVAGASAVQIGTMCFRRPDVIRRVALQLDRLLAEEGTTVAELIGSLQWPRRGPAASPTPSTSTSENAEGA